MPDFWSCNKTFRSRYTWWPGCSFVWGHTGNNTECQGIVVSQKDYDNLMKFANLNRIQRPDTVSNANHQDALLDWS